VRGKDVFVVQSMQAPINDNIVEMLLTISALRNSSAKRITAIIPYYGYQRSSREWIKGWIPFSVQDIAHFLV